MKNCIMDHNIAIETEKFLYAIGIIKMQKENFLSDIVRAISLYNECFLNDFFKFCFPQKEEIEVYSIDREITCFSKSDKNNNGRNDFKIYTADGIYIVESKILDTDVSKYSLYLENLENMGKEKIAYIVSSKNSEYERIRYSLRSDCIRCVCWENFVNETKDKYKDFALIAASILNCSAIDNLKKKPKIRDVGKSLCDDFFKNYLITEHYDKKGGQVDEWEREGGYAYGYTIWASVWFGLVWSPLKGCFWSFAYGNGGNKTIKDVGNFKYINPLGKYMNDGFFYYEVNQSNSEMTIERLKESFIEFANIIDVYENSERISLGDYLRKYKANI